MRMSLKASFPSLVLDIIANFQRVGDGVANEMYPYLELRGE